MNFNINAYQGRWYEIGKYYTPFEKDCTSATADYINNNNSLFIINSCYYDGNLIKQNYGIANVTQKPGTFTLLFNYETVFNNGYFIPSYPSTYTVLWTDYHNYSFVGSTNKNVYWILARKSKLTSQEQSFIIKKTIELGFNPNKVIMNNDFTYF